MPNYLSDGFVSQLGGCNAGLAPTLLPNTQFAAGINISCRDGLVRTRPGFSFITQLANTVGGAFQGAAVYRLNDTDRIVYGVGGTVYVYNLSTGTNNVIGTLSAAADTFYFGQADRYMIVQDGIQRPLIVHEDALHRRAIAYRAYTGDYSTANDVFTGTVTKYGHGRVFTSTIYIHQNDGRPITPSEGRPYFVAGDILDPVNPDTVLKFTETTYLNGGGAAGMPSEYGFITGMEFFRNTTTGNGLGPLIVFAKNGVSSFNVNAPRSTWQDTDFSQVLFSDVGTVSHRSIVPLNDDLLFRSYDGLRSLRYTASQVAGGSGALSSTPISHEVDKWLDQDDFNDIKDVSIAFANNRMCMTTGGRTGQKFNALVCLDTAPAYTLSGQLAPPIYNGIWTGLGFLQVLRAEVAGENRLVALADEGDTLQLYYLNDDVTADGAGATPIQSRLFTRTFDFGQMRQLKRFSHIDIWAQDIQGDVDLTAYYRPEGYALWNACTTAQIKAGAGLAQRRFRVRLVPEDDEVYDAATGQHVAQAVNFQFCLQWTGCMAIEKVVLNAIPVTEEPGICCEEPTTGVSLAAGAGGALISDYDYAIN